MKLFLKTNKMKRGFIIVKHHTRVSMSISKSPSLHLLNSVKAENPFLQNHEDANGSIILMALTPFIG